MSVARLIEAIVDVARRVADFLLQIPQHVEQRLDDLVDGAGSRGSSAQEQQIDVGVRRERAAAVAADGDDRHVRPQLGASAASISTRNSMQGAYDRSSSIALITRRSRGPGRRFRAACARLLARAPRGLDARILRRRAGESPDLSAQRAALAPGEIARAASRRREATLAGRTRPAADRPWRRRCISRLRRSPRRRPCAPRSRPRSRPQDRGRPSRLIALRPVGEVTLISVDAVVDHVDADEDQAAAFELGADAIANLALARRQVGDLRRAPPRTMLERMSSLTAARG